MEEVRTQLRKAVEGMTVEKFGRPAFLGAHSIGALVMHIGEAEWWWMKCNVAGHQLTDEDRSAPYWDVLEDPDAFIKKGYTPDDCFAELDKIRNQTRDLLFTFQDVDLEKTFNLNRSGETFEYSLRWILHHLVDHEAHHKGQILMLKRLMA
jgi:uncharacterized damage-inducible protein DinB